MSKIKKSEIPVLIKILHIVRCRSCGEILTSPRAVKWQEGQRCRWARMEREGTRVYRGPHMKEEVDFQEVKGHKVTSGVKVLYVQTKLGDF
jgi:hypothetical protein